MESPRSVSANSESLRVTLLLGALLLLPLAGRVSTPTRVHACDCNIPSPQEGLLQADAVFSGKVVALIRNDSTLEAFVDVLEMWKGEFHQNTLVRVETADNEAACGFPFDVGENYLIFADRLSDVLHTSICTPTVTLSQVEVREQLGPPLEYNPLNVQFRRGDVDADGSITITDPIKSLLFLFQGGPRPPCGEALDFDDNGNAEISDAIASLTFLFLEGLPPTAPFPECGKDPDLQPLEISDCERYPLCPPRPDTHEVVRVERVGGEVEIEVFSTRPFAPRALFPILCIGTQSFSRSRVPEDGDLNTLIFTLTSDEFEALEEGSLVTVQHGDQCFLDLDQQTLYWSLWVFSPLELSP